MMSVYFLDSSALAKRYLPELGSDWICQILSPSAGNEATVSRITPVEVTSAVVRRMRGGSLTQDQADSILSQFKEDVVSEFVTLEITPAVLDEAIGLVVKHRLRAYDSVQLATACELKRQMSGLELADFRFVSADSELNSAAASEGLDVENPLDHQ